MAKMTDFEKMVKSAKQHTLPKVALSDEQKERALAARPPRKRDDANALSEYASELTDGGRDIILRLRDIAMGQAEEYRLVQGSIGDFRHVLTPVPIAQQIKAAEILLDRLHGRAPEKVVIEKTVREARILRIEGLNPEQRAVAEAFYRALPAETEEPAAEGDAPVDAVDADFEVVSEGDGKVDE